MLKDIFLNLLFILYIKKNIEKEEEEVENLKLEELNVYLLDFFQNQKYL